jgi:hypothetical protein
MTSIFEETNTYNLCIVMLVKTYQRQEAEITYNNRNKNVIRNYNDAPDRSNATSTCTSDVYKWKHWIFAAKSPIKFANSHHTSLLVHLAHVGLNKFENCKDANCIWRTFDPMTKNCCEKIAADDLYSPEFIRLGILKNILKPDRQARLMKLTPFGGSLHPYESSLLSRLSLIQTPGLKTTHITPSSQWTLTPQQFTIYI